MAPRRCTVASNERLNSVDRCNDAFHAEIERVGAAARKELGTVVVCITVLIAVGGQKELATRAVVGRVAEKGGTVTSV